MSILRTIISKIGLVEVYTKAHRVIGQKRTFRHLELIVLSYLAKLINICCKYEAYTDWLTEVSTIKIFTNTNSPGGQQNPFYQHIDTLQ